MYVYTVNNIAMQIITDDDPAFPMIPITERYSPVFLASCVHVDDDTEVQEGWEYRDGIFLCQ